MTMIIEEQELHIGADDWKQVVGMGLKEDFLEEMVQEFLARGGEIQVIPIGVATEALQAKISGYNVVDAAQANLRTQQRIARRSKQDERLVMKLEGILGNHARKELCEILHVSDGKLQRLLREYFHDDPRADDVREGVRDYSNPANLERWVMQVRAAQAQGVRGMWKTAKAANIGYDTLKVLIKKGLVKVDKLDRNGNLRKTK